MQLSASGIKTSGSCLAGMHGCLFSPPENCLSASSEQCSCISFVSLGVGPWAGGRLWAPPGVTVPLPLVGNPGGKSRVFPKPGNTPETWLHKMQEEL